MSTYKMEYEVCVYPQDSVNHIYLKLHSKGIVEKQSINSYSNTLSIFVPKKNNILYSNNYDSFELFTDFKSNILRKGDMISVNLFYTKDFSFYKQNYIEGEDEYIAPNIFSSNNLYYPKYFIQEIIINKTDVEIKCLDWTYFLLNSKVNFSKKNTSIKEIAKIITDEANKSIDEYNNNLKKSIFGKKEIPHIGVDYNNLIDFDLSFSATKSNGVEVLKVLEKNYITNSQIIQPEVFGFPKLQIGINWKVNKEDSANFKKFYFSDIPQDLIATVDNKDDVYYKIINRDNLLWQNESDIKVKVKAKIFDRNGKFKEIISKKSDNQGELRSYSFYDKTGSFNITKFQDILDNELAKLKYNGFKPGSNFLTFGYPKISPNDIVVLDGVGTLRPDRNPKNDIKNSSFFIKKSSYYVEIVETTFNSNGWRQSVGISYLIPNQNEDSIIEKIYKDYTYNSDTIMDEEIQNIYEQQNDAIDKINNSFKKYNINK